MKRKTFINREELKKINKKSLSCKACIWLKIEVLNSGNSYITMMYKDVVVVRNYYQEFPNMNRAFAFYSALGFNNDLVNLMNSKTYYI